MEQNEQRNRMKENPNYCDIECLFKCIISYNKLAKKLKKKRSITCKHKILYKVKI